MKKTFKTVAAVLALLCAACVSDAGAQTIVEEGAVNPTPWSGYWWPTAKREIRTPLYKYDLIQGSKALAWWDANTPANPAPWEGLCHGWAAASILESEPQTPKAFGNTTLTVGDQKGLLSVAHAGDVANMYGIRCNNANDRAAFEDLKPDELWRVLRENIKDRGTAVIVDLEPGPEIWNYPVYKYKVTLGAGRGNVRTGNIELYMASDSVAPDYVGLKYFRYDLTFQISVKNGYAVAGTGKWIGRSVRKHPDFAWVPYLVRSGNPEMPYEALKALLGGAVIPGVPPCPEPGDVEEVDEPDTTSRTDPEPAPEPQADEETVEEVDVEGYVDLEDMMVLLDQPSDFGLEIHSVNPKESAVLGEKMEFFVTSHRDGYLYLVTVDSKGDVGILFPNGAYEPPLLKAKEPIMLPPENATYSFVASEPTGPTKIHAFVFEKKIDLVTPETWKSESAGRKRTEQSAGYENAPSSKGGAPVKSGDETSQIRKRLGAFAHASCTMKVTSAPVETLMNTKSMSVPN